MQTIFHEIGMPFIKSAEPNPMMNTANTKYRMKAYFIANEYYSDSIILVNSAHILSAAASAAFTTSSPSFT